MSLIPTELYWPSGDPPPTGERRSSGARRTNAMASVGTSDHQETLRDLLDRCGRSVIATLVPAPGDGREALVAVVIDGHLVGSLGAEVGERYGPLLRRQATPICCPTTLTGGEWDAPHIGVILDFSSVYVLAHRAAV